MIDRREFLKVSAMAAAGAAAGCSPPEQPTVDPSRFSRPDRSRIAILAHAEYDDALGDTVLRGLRLFDLDVRDRRVLLKPNLVEFDPNGVINTQPALIAATVEAFRKLGAREVVVAEGPGHRRDNEYLLDASGLGYAMRDAGSRYVDLNTDSVRKTGLRTPFTGLGALYLPESVLDADLIVSMPKLKTHKWAGATLSMKNMFGIVPGSVYGWPKNVLHWHGIENSIMDINAALDVPRFNIVDGIVGMEGNGPIQGDARHSGVLVFGADPVAVDATGARLMGLDPTKMAYLSTSATFLGNVEDDRIEQIGEQVSTYGQKYRLLDRFQHLAV
ncbi:MAG TPA: DUF362 domain-containing protein [Longimicrobiales bacterium]|nr:DUF362 domain-containing protein [Longimicrobiales bacterium]